MLYEIAGTNTRILGTLHQVPPGPQRWIEPVRRIFDGAEKIYVEMKAERGIDLFKFPARFMARDLPSDLREAIEPHWPRNVHGDMDQCSLLGMCLFASSLSTPSQVDGVEAVVRAWLGPSRDVLELEAPKDFVQAVEDVPIEDLLLTARFGLRQRPEEAQRLFEAKARAWRVHDLKKLEELIQIGTTLALRRAIFETRNRNWAETIAHAATSPERTLVLCGAGHLCGPNNLREVLERDHGHGVNRLMM